MTVKQWHPDQRLFNNDEILDDETDEEEEEMDEEWEEDEFEAEWREREARMYLLPLPLVFFSLTFLQLCD